MKSIVNDLDKSVLIDKTLIQYSKNFKSSSTSTWIILLNSRTVPVMKTGIFMLWWIIKQRNSTLLQFICAKHHGTLVKKRKVTISSRSGGKLSECQGSRRKTFSIF